MAPANRRGTGCSLATHTVVAFALIAAAAPAVADAGISIRPADEAPVELLSPAPREVLVSGRQSTVAWRARRDLGAAGIEEWEAFLSFDGGHSWPVRITPHLSVERTSFRFSVPLVPSDDVRLMLRFGDERRELGYVLPVVLRSVTPAGPSIQPPPPSPSLDAGEIALPGADPVVMWVEGERDGRHAATRTTWWLPRSGVRPDVRRDLPPATLTVTDRIADGAARTAHAGRPGTALLARSPCPFALRRVSTLQLLCRQNE